MCIIFLIILGRVRYVNHVGVSDVYSLVVDTRVQVVKLREYYNLGMDWGFTNIIFKFGMEQLYTNKSNCIPSLPRESVFSIFS